MNTTSEYIPHVFDHSPISFTFCWPESPDVCATVDDWWYILFREEFWAFEHFWNVLFFTFLIRVCTKNIGVRFLHLLLAALFAFFVSQLWEMMEELTFALNAQGWFPVSGKGEYDAADSILFDPFCHICGAFTMVLIDVVFKPLAFVENPLTRVYHKSEYGDTGYNRRVRSTNVVVLGRWWAVIFYMVIYPTLITVSINHTIKATRGLTTNDRVMRWDWVIVTALRCAWLGVGWLYQRFVDRRRLMRFCTRTSEIDRGWIIMLLVTLFVSAPLMGMFIAPSIMLVYVICALVTGLVVTKVVVEIMY